MADVGTIVTNNEVIGFCPGIDIIEPDSLEKICIKGAEEAVERECQRTFAQTSYSDEEVPNIPREKVYHNITVQPIQSFRVQNPPVDKAQAHAVKLISGRDSSTGAISSSSTLNKDQYWIEGDTGIVSLLKTALISPTAQIIMNYPSFNSWQSWPDGIATVAVDYYGGYAVADIPYGLKFLVLKIVARYHAMAKQQKWHIRGISGEFGTADFIDEELTDREIKDLGKYKLPVYA